MSDIFPIVAATVVCAAVCVATLFWITKRHRRSIKEEKKQDTMYINNISRRVNDMMWEDFKKEIQPIGRYEFNGGVSDD